MRVEATTKSSINRREELVDWATGDRRSGIMWLKTYLGE